jgi:hypothetical protein
VILKVFGVLDVPMQEQVRVPLGDVSNQVEVRPNAGLVFYRSIVQACFFLFIISIDLLAIYLLDVGARKREQRRHLYAASKDAINTRRREMYAQKKAFTAATLQTNNGFVLSEHENLLDGDDDSWLRRNSSYTRSENVVPGKYIIKFIIRECFS